MLLSQSVLFLLHRLLVVVGAASSSQQNVSVLDFERSVILHLPKFKPQRVFSQTPFILFQYVIDKCSY